MAKAISTYVAEDGCTVTVYQYRKPAKASRTWPMVKGSIANMGRQAITLASEGLTKRKHG
jgi:hypothetical protein